MTGVVTSNKMTKALVVTVFSTKLDSKYKKRYKAKKKYVASCLDSKSFQVGDTVRISPSIPVSKTIRWKIVN